MAEIEELRTQPQDIQAEQSVLGASLSMRENWFLFVSLLSQQISLNMPIG